MAEEQTVVNLSEMLPVTIYNRQGESVGTMEVDPADFGGKISKRLLHEVVLMYLCNQRAGTHSTLRRGEVAGSTKKLFRQKGTGNARVGTRRTNKRRGGGTAKGPKPHDYEYHLPKKAVRAATRMAVLSKILDKQLVVLDELKLDAIKTKDIVTLLKALKVESKKVKNDDGTEAEVQVSLYDKTVLIGLEGRDVMLYKSARNIEGVEAWPTHDLNAYTVLKQKYLVMSRAALDALRTKTDKAIV